MRNLLALLFASLLYSTGAFAWNSGASCPSGQYDMLGWKTPSGGSSTVHNEGQYLAGPNQWGTSYAYFVINGNSSSGTIFTIKEPQGYPWDIELYDSSYIYFYETGLSFSTDRDLHKWAASGSPPTTPAIFLPRCSPGGSPGWAHTNSSTTDYHISGNPCSTTSSTFPTYYGQVWGPSNETLGGNLPANNPTLIYVLTEYYDAGDGYGATWHQEWQYMQEGYGWVWWNFFSWNGSSYVWTNGTSMNTQTNGGAPAYSNPCG